MKAIVDLGYESPTPIQVETLPLLLKKNTDFLGLAATGTGKTAAFGIPLLENLDPSLKHVQGLILCPTRELAKQVAEQINLLARYKKSKALAIYGGSDYGGQLRALKEGVAIVVGTPGRIIDHLERGTLNFSKLSTVVLDEADEMISMGFRDEIETILETVTESHDMQTWLFSATMSKDVRKIADRFLTDPKQIQINKTEVVTSAVQQFFYQVREEEKPEIIGRLMDQVPQFYGLIFCQTKALVIELTQTLKHHGYAADCLHGDMEQNARERTMKAFKAKQVTVLVCTDVASRGIDVKELTHVINYSLPRELDLYVHRIGRTGRGGKEGIALSLVTPSHMGLVRKIEQMTQSRMTKLPVPQEKDVMILKADKALRKFLDLTAEEEEALENCRGIVRKSAAKEELSQLGLEELLARYLVKTIKLKKEAAAPAEASFGERPTRHEKRAQFRKNFAAGGKGRPAGKNQHFKGRPFGNFK